MATQIRDLRGNGVRRREVARLFGISESLVKRYTNPRTFALRMERRLQTKVRTTIGGVRKWYKVDKRPRPSTCELCKGPSIRSLSWHHWDDNHLELGLWLCHKCHLFAEACERGILNEYLKLKKEVEGELYKYTFSGPEIPVPVLETGNRRSLLPVPA